MTKREQELQTTSVFANIITLVAGAAAKVTGVSEEAMAEPEDEIIHLIGSKLQKKLAPHART